MSRDELLTKMAMEVEPSYWPPSDTEYEFGGFVFGWNEYQLRRTELINKPSWDDAPERAQWLAQDADARWRWSISEPRAKPGGYWICEKGKAFASEGTTPSGHNWRDTLEPRPQSQATPQTCRHCDIEFRRPHVDGIPDDRCTRCDDEIKALWPEHEPAKTWWTRKTCTQCGHATAAKVSDDNPVCPGCVALGPDVSDPVNHPAHYQSDNGIECIDAIRAALGREGFIAYCRGNSIKYAWRSDRKGKAAEDKRKAAWYLERAAKELEE